MRSVWCGPACVPWNLEPWIAVLLLSYLRLVLARRFKAVCHAEIPSERPYWCWDVPDVLEWSVFYQLAQEARALDSGLGRAPVDIVVWTEMTETVKPANFVLMWARCVSVRRRGRSPCNGQVCEVIMCTRHHWCSREKVLDQGGSDLGRQNIS